MCGASGSRGVLLGSQFLLIELCPFLDHEALCLVIHNLSSGLLQCALHGAILENHLEATIGPECRMQTVLEATR